MFEQEVPEGREREFDLLKNLFNAKGDVVPLIFVTGNKGQGKTLVLKKLSESVKSSWVSCIELCSKKKIFESILQQFGHKVRCENAASFQLNLSQISKALNAPLFLIFDKAERLRDKGICGFLSNLGHNLNVCVVMISSLPWQHFHELSCTPFAVRFSQYSKESVVNIAKKACPSNENEHLFESLARVLYDVLHKVCNDPNELSYLTTKMYQEYSNPVKSGKVPPENKAKLYSLIQPTLKTHFYLMYLREPIKTHNKLLHSEAGYASASEYVNTLPYCAKVLILSSFLASHTSHLMDFGIPASARKVPRKVLRKTLQNPLKLLAPGAFSIAKLMHIFNNISEVSLESNSDIQALISTLISHNLITRVSRFEDLNVKCKCNFTLSLASEISRNIGFNLGRFISNAR